MSKHGRAKTGWCGAGAAREAEEDQRKKDNPPMTPPARMMGHLRTMLGLAAAPGPAPEDMVTPTPR